MIWSLFIGLIVGAVAKFIFPGRDGGGLILTMLLGVAGSWVGGQLGVSLGLYLPGEPVGFVASVIGAMIILLIFRFIKGRA